MNVEIMHVSKIALFRSGLMSVIRKNKIMCNYFVRRSSLMSQKVYSIDLIMYGVPFYYLLTI